MSYRYLCALVVVAGCNDSDGGAVAETATDTTETVTETVAETVPETESVLDTMPGTETVADTETAADTETETETVAETVAETAAETVTETVTETIPPPALPPSQWTGCGAYDAAEIGFPLGSPNVNRLVVALSDDGLTWTKTGTVVVEHADVPAAIITDDGMVVLYFISFCASQRNTLQAAVSRDLATWSLQHVTLTGPRLGVDPAVVAIDATHFRLYYTRAPNEAQSWDAPGNTPHTYVAEGSTPFAFTEVGSAFADADDGPVLDPTVLVTGDTWRIFAGGPMDRVRQGASSDGLTFTQGADLVFGMDRFSNGLAVPGGYRMYGFDGSPQSANVISYTSSDGAAWTKDSGKRLSPDAAFEEAYVKDPTVVHLADGRYAMIYVTRIPGILSAH